jgi:hypothetical protein
MFKGCEEIMGKQVLGLDTDYEMDIGGYFLSLKGDGLTRNDLISYQVEMLINNQIPGLINLEIREKDTEVNLFYRINGMITLANYLGRQKISKQRFMVILDSILKVILNAKIYFLDENSFVMDEHHIYINPDTNAVCLLYVPMKTLQNIQETARTFISNLLINIANIDTQDNFVQQVLRMTKEEGFIITEFRKKLKELNGTTLPDKDIIDLQVTQPISGLSETTWPQVPSFQKPLQGIPKWMDDKEINDGDIDTKKAETVPEDNSGVNVNRKILLTFLAVISMASAVYTNFEYIKGYLYQAVPLSKWLIVAAMAITGVAAACYFIFGKAKPEALQDSVLNEPDLDLAEQDDKTLEHWPDETVLLYQQNHPVLKGLNGEPEIIVDNQEIIIGRNEEICSHVIENKSIGRAHIRINMGLSGCFITDLDSKNGTYLNGEKLLSNKEYPLNNNDRLLLANTEYCFCSP